MFPDGAYGHGRGCTPRADCTVGQSQRRGFLRWVALGVGPARGCAPGVGGASLGAFYSFLAADINATEVCKERGWRQSESC